MKLHILRKQNQNKKLLLVTQKTSKNLQQWLNPALRNMKSKLVFLYTDDENVSCHNLCGKESDISGLLLKASPVLSSSLMYLICNILYIYRGSYEYI